MCMVMRSRAPAATGDFIAAGAAITDRAMKADYSTEGEYLLVNVYQYALQNATGRVQLRK